MDDLISRQAAIKAIEDLQDCYNGFSDTYDKACIIGVLEELQSAQPTLYGYSIEHLALIATIMQKEHVIPEKALEYFKDIQRMGQMIIDEQQEIIKRAVEKWTI